MIEKYIFKEGNIYNSIEVVNGILLDQMINFKQMDVSNR